MAFFVLSLFCLIFMEAVAVVVILFIPEVVILTFGDFFHKCLFGMSEFTPHIVDTTCQNEAFLFGQHSSDADILGVYPFVYPVVIVLFYYKGHSEAPYFHGPPGMA